MTESKKTKKRYQRPSALAYLLARLAAWPVCHFIFRRRVRRNEIRQTKGGFVVIANHECALDFVNLIGLCPRRMTFVLSHAFYSTLPLQRVFDKLGVIPKQQFQTELSDIKRMKAVVAAGEPLVLYPAGLMCPDGLSTPIPQGTASLLRLLDADVYMARTTGAYHVMPKWSKRLRPGRTYMDVYRLFTREEMHTISKEELRRRTEEALAFDAYAEQEKLRIRYCAGDDVEGLEQVVYQCPVCHEKHSIRAAGNTMRCERCGFSATADRCGLLCSEGSPLRHISQWNTELLRRLGAELTEESAISLPCTVHTLDRAHHRFREAGKGTVALTAQELSLEGQVNGEALSVRHSVVSFPCLPNTPGRFVDIQNGQEIYRCYPQDGKRVMEFVNMLMLLHRRGLMQTAKYGAVRE